MENFQLFYTFTSFLFGTVIGSFLNVVILRLPKEVSLDGRSYCFNCKHKLSTLDLIPIVSYLFLAGKCRYCKHKISKRYFIIEAITGLLFAFSAFNLNPIHLPQFILLLKYFVVISSLIVVFVVDLEHFLIFDSVIVYASIFVVLLNLVSDLSSKTSLLSFDSNFLGGFLAAILAVIPFYLVWYVSKGQWLGFGDVKFVVLLGFILGFPNIFVGLMVAILVGGVVASFLLATTSKTLKTRIPFGTFLSVGSLVAVFYGHDLLSWYLSFLGF